MLNKWLKKLQCATKGHRVLCKQDYVLDEKIIKHNHYCLNCAQHRDMGDMPIEDEMIEILTALLPSQSPAAEETKTYIH